MTHPGQLAPTSRWRQWWNQVVAFEQAMEMDDVSRLAARVAQLERRIKVLESGATAAGPSQPPSRDP
jgi:hypothetical protein